MMLGMNLAASTWVSLLLWLSLWANGIDAGVPRTDLKALLTDPARAWSSKTTLSFAGSQQFLDATERWTIFSPPTYQAAISPGTEDDVRKIVKLAAGLKIPFLATGGRHSYTTTIGDLQNGLAIDLSHMKSLYLDRRAKTVTIGPGITIGDVFDPLYEAGFEIQTGSCSCPSLIGVTLGGGVGRYQGIHGLVIDSLLSVRIVTATGEMVEASKNRNADLFWAIRGAGANFGVVTSATYQVHPLTNKGNVLSSEFIFPAEMSSDYFKVVQSMNNRLPAELASVSIINFNSSTNETQVSASWVYIGPEDKGRKALAPILNLNPPVSRMSIIPWNRLISSIGGGIDQVFCQGNQIRDLYSLNMKNYSASTYDSSFVKMAEFFDRYPGGRDSILQLELFPNQAMAAVPSDETAFKWRDATGYLNPEMMWKKGDQVTAKAAQRLGRELRRDLAATSGYSEQAVFINYARGDEKLHQIYGRDKLPRLAELKKTWDPNGIFSFNNGLPTKYP